MPELQERKIAQDRDLPLHQQRYQRSSTLACLDLSGYLHMSMTQFEPRVSINHRYADCWTYIDGPPSPRVDACVRAMEIDPDSIALMEVTFTLNLRHVGLLLVMLRYNPEAPICQMYKAIGHAFRIVE